MKAKKFYEAKNGLRCDTIEEAIAANKKADLLAASDALAAAGMSRLHTGHLLNADVLVKALRPFVLAAKELRKAREYQKETSAEINNAATALVDKYRKDFGIQ
jgi:hypothetical protein